MNNIEDDQYCFVCGKKNENGLRLEFFYNNNKIFARVVFDKRFQGWKDVVHGGLVSTVLDEAMAKITGYLGYYCVTAEINIKFKNPVSVGKEYVVEGEIIERRGKIFFTKSCLKDISGNVFALANGKMFLIKDRSEEIIKD